MALYFPDRATAFQELRVGDAAVELYGKQSREALRTKYGNPNEVFKLKTREQREKASKR